MEVLLANEYGFCFGVERAVEMVEDALGAGAPVRTLGPLIHNTQEMQRLECEGVSTVQDPAQVSKNEIAVIRAHGVTPQVQAELEKRAAQVVDATCPFVTRVQRLAVCQEQCAKSFLIETQDEIDPADLREAKRVGVTAGASTPNWLIDQVVTRLREVGRPL